jgi:predicted double-glycine peptidase
MAIRSVALSALLLLCMPSGQAIELPAIAGARLMVPVASLKQIRFATTLRQQYDFSCGSAAVATLLTHHYAHPVSEQFVFERMFAGGDQLKIRKEGFSLLDIKRFLSDLGYQADGFRLPLQRLIDAKLPAIVLVSDKGYHHFVVIKGVADGRILVGDPANGTRALPRAAFEQIWSNKLLFVIHGSPRLPSFNTVADWRAAPAAPVRLGINRDGLGGLAMPRLGPGDF